MTTPGPREERFRALFADANGDMLRFAQRRVHPAHAEDVVAEAFLVSWRRLDDAPTMPGDLRAWLFGITRNCLLNARRGQQRQHALTVRLTDTPTVSAVSSDQANDFVARRLDLGNAWPRLSAGDQDVLALTVIEE